jgi:hypothetical protein
MTEVLSFPAPRPGSGRRWGKAGVPLSAEDAEAARRARVAEVNKEQIRHEQHLEAARRDWKAGHVQPWRITQALDAAGKWGPEVDEKCGGTEPMVDEWEEGVRYPAWEQLLKLAALVGVTPAMFMVRPGQDPIPAKTTSMRFHADLDDEPKPVLAFTAEAVRQTLGGSA